MSEKTNQAWHFSRSSSAWVAALPPVIFGLGAALMNLMPFRGSLALTVVLWSGTALVIIAGGLAALLKRLPDWGWTWMGSGLMVTAITLIILAKEMAETGGYILSAAGDLALMGLILAAGFVLLLIAASRGWQPGALVSLGFAAMFGLVNLSLLSSAPLNRTDLALSAFPAGLLFAFLIIIFIRGSDAVRGLLLGGVWVLNAGILTLQHLMWQPWFMQRGSMSPLVPMLVFSTGFLLSGPLLGLLRKPFLRLLGRA